MTPSPITPGDSLAAVVAELRSFERGYSYDTNRLADRIERLDAEMHTERSDLDAECNRWMEVNEQFRAKLAACERLRHEWLARAASTTQRQYANRILDCANDLNNALASRAAGEK